MSELPDSFRHKTIRRANAHRVAWEFAEMDKWLAESIDPAERREWLDSGALDFELDLVVEWKKCGMTPADLVVTWPSGRTALDYLRTRKYRADQIAEATQRRKRA